MRMARVSIRTPPVVRCCLLGCGLSIFRRLISVFFAFVGNENRASHGVELDAVQAAKIVATLPRVVIGSRGPRTFSCSMGGTATPPGYRSHAFPLGDNPHPPRPPSTFYSGRPPA